MTNGPKILIYLFRRDLRVSDNPVFHEICRAHASGASPHFTHVMPLYVFPAQQMEVSGFLRTSESNPTPKSPYPEARSEVGKFWRCGSHRAKFMAESVWDLKKSLDKKDSGLCIRVGRLAEVVQDALDFYEKEGLDTATEEQTESKEGTPKSDPSVRSSQRGEVVGVWMTTEVTTEEQDDEKAVQKVVEARGKEFRSFVDEKYFIDE
jgi:deoxyribodipyrimidine photo-lyase